MKNFFKIILSRNTIYCIAVMALLMKANKATAQQEAMYSQYMFNMLAVNPAYAGSRDVLSVTGLYRQMWVGITGAPTTMTFSADMPLSRERVGIGFQVFSDKLGQFSNNGAYGSYAFRIKVSEKATLALGLQAGFLNFGGNLVGVGTNAPDPAFSSNLSKFLPNFGTGIYFSTDKFYVGVSVPQLIRNRLGDYVSPNNIDQVAQQQRHFFGMFGGVLRLNHTFKLKPSFLVKAVSGAPLTLDANMNLWIRDKIAIGGSYRTSNLKFEKNAISKNIGDAIIGLLEVQLSDQLRFGYAYDYMINDLGNYNSGTHEVMLRYEFGYGKKRILTPRYF